MYKLPLRHMVKNQAENVEGKGGVRPKAMKDAIYCIGDATPGWNGQTCEMVSVESIAGTFKCVPCATLMGGVEEDTFFVSTGIAPLRDL